MADRIDDLVGQEAYEQVIKLDKMMGDLVTKFDLTAKSALSMQAAIGDTKSLAKLMEMYKKLQAQQEQNKQIEDKLEKTIRLKDAAIMEMNLAIQEQNKQTKATIQMNQAAEGSINQLRLQLNQATKAYDAMGKAERESGKGTTLLTNIQNTTTALKQLEANTGRFQRNVGNYTGATMQLTQVMRELPNFAQSAEIGIRSLSNNLPMLADSFGQVRKEAGGTLPALKIFGASLFSFAGLFPIVLGLLISYSSEIGNLLTGTEALTEAEKEQIKVKNEAARQVSSEIANAKVQLAIIMETSNSTKERSKAYDTLNATYPELLSNMTKEEALNGGIAASYEGLVIAIEKTIRKKSQYSLLEKEITEQTRLQNEINRMMNPAEGEFIYFSEDQLRKVQGELSVVNDRIKQITKSIAQQNELDSEYFGKRVTGTTKTTTGGTTKAITTTGGTTRTKAEPKAKREPDVLEKMKTNLAQLSLESKASMKEGIEDNMNEASKLMAAQLTELQKKVNENGLTLTIEWTNADKFESFIENATPVMEAINGIVQNFQAATQDLVSIGTDKIQRDAEAELEAIDATTEAELEAIDRLTISETEREERKKKVETEAETRRRNIERKKVQDLQKFARMQKAADVLAITSATALAVMNTLADKKLIALGLNVPAAIAVGVAGAAQIAAVLAKPLPQYELGTPEGGHIGGKAIVGEAGTELGIRPDGSMFLTPSKASIMDLPKRTEIIPHDITKDLLGATMVRLAQANQAVTLDMYQDELIEEFKRGTDKIANEIRKNRTNISIGSSFRDYVKYNQL